jgi:hypothetical protein
MDWVKDFIDKFSNDEEISKLKEKQFYGHLTINFFRGQVVDLNKMETRKPKVK